MKTISEKMYSSNNFIPIVAIIGKPNVGKSSLFNRIIKKRKAIISEEPGVTRDINYEIITCGDAVFKLADSAGFTECGEDIIHKLTQKRNKLLIDEASIILFTCDVNTMDTRDFDIAQIIRKSGKPCILLINKVDNEKLREGIYDFFDLGLEEPLPISAIHGKNINTLKKILIAKILNIYKSRDLIPQNQGYVSSNNSHIINVAIVGKPNVGKSSLLNLLVNSERSLVTPDPGTTRDAVEETISYGGSMIKIVDTAGIRKRRKIRENIEFYSLVRAEKAVKESVLSILLIDAETGITTQDKKIASIVIKEKKGLIIAANKWDRAKEKGIDQDEFIKDVYYFFPHISFAEVVTISAKTGYNKIKLLKKILTVYNNYNMMIKTRDLNSLLRNLVHPGAHIKYGIQKSSAPPVFEFFIGRTDINNTNFERFIVNSIRKNFEFKGVPIKVNLRKR